MKPSEKFKQQSRDFRLQQAVEQLQSAAQQFRSAMEPYQHKMEADDGLLGMVMVSGIAMLVHSGIESPAALDSTIEMAAARSGIPKEAFEAYAHFTTAMIKAMEIRHQNNSPR